MCNVINMCCVYKKVEDHWRRDTRARTDGREFRRISQRAKSTRSSIDSGVTKLILNHIILRVSREGRSFLFFVSNDNNKKKNKIKIKNRIMLLQQSFIHQIHVSLLKYHTF